MARRKRSGSPARCSRYVISKSALYTLFGYLESRLVTDTLKEKIDPYKPMISKHKARSRGSPVFALEVASMRLA